MAVAVPERTGSAEDSVLAAFLGLTVPEGYRAELIEGEIIVTPPPDGDHEDIVGKVIRRVIRLSSAELYVSGGRGIITPLGRFIPDCTFASEGVFQGRDPWAEPEGVVMTVEVTSLRPEKDRDPKRRGYAAAGIPLYLLIDRTEGTTTLYAEPKDGDYRQHTRVPFGKPLDLPEPLSFTLDTSIFG